MVLDWHNDMSKLILNDRIEAAADDRAGDHWRLRRALDE